MQIKSRQRSITCKTFHFEQWYCSVVIIMFCSFFGYLLAQQLLYIVVSRGETVRNWPSQCALLAWGIKTRTALCAEQAYIWTRRDLKNKIRKTIIPVDSVHVNSKLVRSYFFSPLVIILQSALILFHLSAQQYRDDRDCLRDATKSEGVKKRLVLLVVLDDGWLEINYRFFFFAAARENSTNWSFIPYDLRTAVLLRRIGYKHFQMFNGWGFFFL